jgi:hypothetical protein
MMLGHLTEQIYKKDQTIKSLEHRIDSSRSNFKSIVSSRVNSQSNRLAYELDSTKRVLDIFKASL